MFLPALTPNHCTEPDLVNRAASLFALPSGSWLTIDAMQEALMP